MPSTYAHYRLGQQVRRELEGNERKIIEKYPQLYLIGLHGPDILFYYKPLRPNPVNQIGYAWGYAGSCIPFVVCLVFVLGYQKMGLSFETGMMIAFAVVAVWWLGFHRTASCIACDTVCCISVFHSVWQACGKIRYRKADFNLYCCVYGDYHFAVFMKAQWQFWVLAIFVGMFQGGIQALSRSYFAKIVPPERSGEYFGLMDICGKGASFMGTTVVGLASQAFGSINIGISAIVFLFLAGALFFMKTEHSGSESMKNQENVIMEQQMFHD